MAIETVKANSKDGGEVYRLLNMVHSMAGSLANSPRKEFRLARTQSDPMYGPVVTVWTNGIVDIEARSYTDEEPTYHEYSMYACAKDETE
ncbi:MAG: hypothetical protein K5804_17810 [Microbacterium sp.]|uniref:hypothetical protein n=1 Tax=Microbacterium sp. TaxID=51671 RepID=UPI0026243353|nr:hypothetical protein [Microbacterium sp.]MCV0420101.1 hypothetical protein [Microbacterium sp.]